jgi:hypothetical protein
MLARRAAWLAGTALRSPAPLASSGLSSGASGGHHPVLDSDDGDGDGLRVAIPWVRTVISGVELLRNPRYNKGMAFTEDERDRLYLRGARLRCVWSWGAGSGRSGALSFVTHRTSGASAPRLCALPLSRAHPPPS